MSNGSEGDASDPGSPCISLCRIDERSGWCEGCLRSLDEIAAWGTMSAADKRRVWALLPQRRSASDAVAAGEGAVAAGEGAVAAGEGAVAAGDGAGRHRR